MDAELTWTPRVDDNVCQGCDCLHCNLVQWTHHHRWTSRVSREKFRDGVGGGGVSIIKSRYESNFMYRGIKRRWNVLSRVLFQNKVSQRHLHKERATQTSLSSHSSQSHLQDGVGRCRFGLHTQNPSYHVLSYCVPKTRFNMQFFNYCHSGQLRLYWHWIFTVKHSIAVYENHTLLCLNELYVLCVFNALACN